MESNPCGRGKLRKDAKGKTVDQSKNRLRISYQLDHGVANRGPANRRRHNVATL
jgi:hypothetical protein